MRPVLMLLLALAISADGFAAGFAYGLRRVRLPFLSVLIVSFTSAAVFFLSMQAGGIITRLLSPDLAAKLGAVIIISVGLWSTQQSLTSGHDCPQPATAHPGNGREMTGKGQQILKLRLRPFGLVIHILREPLSADFDASGAVSGWEAFALGLALALDALGAGVGASMTGFSAALTSVLVGVTKFAVLTSGVALGQLCGRRVCEHWVLRYLPGAVLVFLGVWRLMGQ